LHVERSSFLQGDFLKVMTDVKRTDNFVLLINSNSKLKSLLKRMELGVRIQGKRSYNAATVADNLCYCFIVQDTAKRSAIILAISVNLTHPCRVVIAGEPSRNPPVNVHCGIKVELWLLVIITPLTN